ncbi:MAG: 50S ribosomal protein L24 [Bdellovibrionota bacterium]
MRSEAGKISLKKGDEVQVMAGREKGKTGKVLTVNSKSWRVTIEKVNLVKKAVKPSQKHPQGGMLEKEIPLAYSNVLLYCTKCNRGVRHGNRVVGDKKVRFCRKCKEVLDSASK